MSIKRIVNLDARFWIEPRGVAALMDLDTCSCSYGLNGNFVVCTLCGTAWGEIKPDSSRSPAPRFNYGRNGT